MDAIGVLHEKLVFGRRARVLAEELVKAIPDEGRYCSRCRLWQLNNRYSG